MTLSPAIFLDRDDTIIACREVVPDGDLGNPALVRLLPGVLEGCQALKAAGFKLVVVSNQGGVARGKYGIADVEAVNARLNELLGRPPGIIDAFFFCPYHPRGVVPEFTREHPWRKPQPGMILDAAAALGIDLARSWLIGDAVRDIEAGRAAGVRTVLLTRGDEVLSDLESGSPDAPDFTAPDFASAASIILRESAG